MADLNRFVGTGRLIKDVPTPSVVGNTERVFFSIACNGIKKEDVVFISCCAWGQSAKYLQQYAKKGNLVAVDGQLKTYRTKEGSTSWFINCTSVVNYQKNNEPSNYGYGMNEDESYTINSVIDEDDVPF